MDGQWRGFRRAGGNAKKPASGGGRFVGERGGQAAEYLKGMGDELAANFGGGDDGLSGVDYFRVPVGVVSAVGVDVVSAVD